MKTLSLAPGFVRDHDERDLPCGTIEYRNNRAFVTASEADFRELLDDAEHYAHTNGPDCIDIGLKSSARAVRNALRKHFQEAH